MNFLNSPKIIVRSSGLNGRKPSRVAQFTAAVFIVQGSSARMETIDPSDPSPLLPNLETKKTEEKVKKVTFDDVLAELGEFGLEQKINYFLFSLPYILTSMQLMGWVFVGASFPHRCRVPGDEPETWIQGSGLNSSFSEYNSDWESNSCSRKLLNIKKLCLQMSSMYYVNIKSRIKYITNSSESSNKDVNWLKSLSETILF